MKYSQSENKTLGLIGGTSWVSTLRYYELINLGVQKVRGGNRSARILLHSVDFQEIEDMQAQDNWSKITEMYNEILSKMKNYGVDSAMICTNTLHKIIDKPEFQNHIPVIDIREALVNSIKERKINRVAVLGTKYLMQSDFFTGSLKKEGLEVLLPEEDLQNFIHQMIFGELTTGKLLPASISKFNEIIFQLEKDGADRKSVV